jgi:hypothetical protein
MSGPVQPENDFFDLLFAVAEDRLSPGQAARLEELLLADPARYQQYADFMLMVARLHWTRSERLEAAVCGSTPLQGVPPSPLQGVPPAPFEGVPSDARPVSFILHPFAALAGSVVFSYALCVLLFGAGVLGALAWQSRADHSAALGPADGVPTFDISDRIWVGRVTKAVNCRWANPATGPEDAARGNIDLVDGMFEITYGAGLTISTVGGPVTYTVESGSTVSLSRGLLVVVTSPPSNGIAVKCFGPRGPCIVVAPPALRRNGDARQASAAGGAAAGPVALHPPFQVRTPSGTFTDHGGTMFRVLVENATTTVAHVYSGKVDFQAAPDGKRPPPVLPLGAGGFVFTGRKPDGGELVVFGTEKDLPAVLARRLAKGNFPIYSQDTREKATGSVPGS